MEKNFKNVLEELFENTTYRRLYIQWRRWYDG